MRTFHFKVSITVDDEVDENGMVARTHETDAKEYVEQAIAHLGGAMHPDSWQAAFFRECLGDEPPLRVVRFKRPNGRGGRS